MAKQETQSVSNQNNSTYWAKFMDNADFSACSRFAQGLVAANMLTQSLEQNVYLREMNDASSNFLKSSVGAGFGSAVTTLLEGLGETAGGAGLAGAGGYQAKESVKNAAKIKDLQDETGKALAECKSPDAAIKGVNDPTANKNAASQNLELQLNAVDDENQGPVELRLEEQPLAQPQATPSQTSQPAAAATPSQQPSVAEAAFDATVQNNAVAAETPDGPLQVTVTEPTSQTNSSVATNETQPASTTASQPEAPSNQVSKPNDRPPEMGVPTSALEKSNIKLPSEERILSEHKTKLAKVEQENTQSNNIGTLIQGASQSSQLLTQGSRSIGKGKDVAQQTFDKTSNSIQAAGESTNKAVERMLINPFQANEASVRA